MAQFYGDNATLRDSDVPSSKIKVQDQHGRVRRAYDEITFAAELTTSDALDLMKLPAGAKVIGAQVSCPDLGTTGVLDIGWLVSADGGEVADPNGLFAALDVKAAANDRTEMSYAVAGFEKEFSEAVVIQIVPSENTDAATGLKLQLAVYYVVD